MTIHALIILAGFIAAPPSVFNIQEYSAQSKNATLYVLPDSTAARPDIAILDEATLSVYRGDSQAPVLKHSIPKDTLLFDLFDTNDDGVAELFVLTPHEIRHYPSADNETTLQLFSIDPPLPWTVQQPFLHPVVFNYNDTLLAAIPHQDHILLQNLEGKTISTLPKVLSEVHALFSIPVRPNQIAPEGAFEFRVDTLLTTPITVPQELRPVISPNQFTTVTPRQLRDSEQLELNLWPTFPLSRSVDNPVKVVYASYAPEHIHTVIRIKKQLPRNIPGPTEPFRFSPPRIYPGTIGLSDAGLPDFNNDGFHDLLLWKIPIPGNSISTLINSIRAQTWPIEITTHLYNPKKGLYESRPTNRIKTTVSLQYILTRQTRSPLHNLSFADLNNDGNSDITFSPRADRIATWLYQPKLHRDPDYSTDFSGPVSLITLNKTETPEQSQSILLRGKRSIYRINIPEADTR